MDKDVKAIDTGGPAFPLPGFTAMAGRKSETLYAPVNGMSLRDYFAAQVLMGMHARDDFDPGLATPEQRARLAYVNADAMLAERAKAST